MVRASGIRGYVATMRGLGVDPLPLLRRHRISPASLDDDDALLSLRSAVHLLEASAAEADCPDLGLRISQHQDIGVLGPLGVVMQNAATAKEAVLYASRLLFLQSPGLKLVFNDKSPLIDGAVELVFEVHLEGHPAQRQTIDLCLGTTHAITRLLTGEHYQLKAVTLPHMPVAPLAVYRQFFGASVIANQERAALHVGRAMLRVAPRGANPALRQITEDYLSRHFRTAEDTVSARVRLALRRMLGTPQANKIDIAAMLAMHPRTLQRRLEAEGTGFEIIREELRKEMTLHYLRKTKVPIGQLAAILGFPEQSALSRSSRRWFGITPSALRQQSAAVGLQSAPR